MKQIITVQGSVSAGQIIHHDPRGYSGIQGFRTAAHGQAETVRGDGFDRVGNTVSFIADHQHKGRSDIASIIEGFAVQLGRKDGEPFFFQFFQSIRKR